MPIWLRNLQSSVRFSEHLLRFQCNLLLNLVHASRYDVSVVCMESEGIRNLNRVYRKVDEPTDVLAFPYHEDIRAGSLPVVHPDREHDYNLGDVILGMSVIGEQCACEGVRLEHRLPIIFTHGLCHLLGYQHDTTSHTEKMYKREAAVLMAYNNCFGTTLVPLTSLK